MSTLPRLPYNATVKEIFDSVRYYYPNLGPLLSQLHSRFGQYDEDHIEYLEKQIENLQKYSSKLQAKLNDPDNIPDNLCCPHCGSKF